MTNETKDYKQAQAALTVISMLHRRADGIINEANDKIEKFTAELKGDNPAYAFRWGHGVMQQAANLETAISIKNHLSSDGFSIWSLRDSATDRIKHAAKYPEFSTSPTSNLMAQFSTAAIASWVEILDQAIAHLEAHGIKSTTDEA